MLAPPVMPAAVSVALATIVEGAPQRGTVLGASGPAVWVDIGGTVLVATAPGAVRLPNGVAAASSEAAAAFASIAPDDPATAGGGALLFETVRLRAARWFDPRPALPRCSAGYVAGRLALLAGEVEPRADHGLAAAIARHDDGAAFEAASRSIGSGDGLTPAGDDLVAGTVAAALLVARSSGAGGIAAAVGRLEGPLMDHAAGATTSFSAALLRHAFRGEVAEPAAALLAALCGRGDPVAAARVLQAVGHSSGPALAAGVVAGAGAVVERSA